MNLIDVQQVIQSPCLLSRNNDINLICAVNLICARYVCCMQFISNISRIRLCTSRHRTTAAVKMSVKMNVIVAVSENMGIGINGDLPWRLK